jgi:hypothetical protein
MFGKREGFKIALDGVGSKGKPLNLQKSTINTNTDLIPFNCVTFYEVGVRTGINSTLLPYLAFDRPLSLFLQSIRDVHFITTET